MASIADTSWRTIARVAAEPPAIRRMPAWEAQEPDAGAGEALLPQATFDAFQAGSQEAMMEVVRLHHVRLIGFIRLHTRRVEIAEELAQEVFVEAWHQRARITGPAALRPWLFTVARRKAMREMSRKKHSSELFLGDEAIEGAAPPERPDQHRGIAQDQLRAHLHSALDQLRPEERELVTLRYFGELRIREVAEALGMPMGSVGVLLGRALAKVRKTLEARGLSPEDLGS